MGSLIFLGTCGGRFATYMQTRSTGGIYYQGRCNLHIDPGPGALIRLKEAGLDPTLTDGLLVSHCHPDHYTDAEVLVEAMTRGRTRRRGTLIASRSVLKGHRGIGPGVSRFHQESIGKVHLAIPGRRYSIRGFKVEPLPTRHSDRTAVGFRLRDPDGHICYTGDTSPFEALSRHLSRSRVLIISNTRPRGANIPHHMDTGNSLEIIRAVGPELAILTHFGLKLLKGDPVGEAKWVEEQCGVQTVAAWDGMRVDIGQEITVK